MGGGASRSARDDRQDVERLREFLDYHISRLSDEDKKWVDRVMAMNDEDAQRAISQKQAQTMIEEGRRRDYEHFLGQIP